MEKKSRKILLMANWKMHKSKLEISDYFTTLKSGLQSYQNPIELIFALPYPYLDFAKSCIKETSVQIAAQNVHWLDKGAFTGEISVPMLQDCGVQSVIIGHSERRTIFKEDDQMVAAKVHQCLSHNLQVVLCVGETLEERQKHQTFDIVSRQLDLALVQVSQLDRIVIAYEPVWAIGTGVSATSDQAHEVHRFIRQHLSQKFSQTDRLRILYGGSMNVSNVADLLQQEHIDGGLIGGAALDAKTMLDMIAVAYKIEVL